MSWPSRGEGSWPVRALGWRGYPPRRPRWEAAIADAALDPGPIVLLDAPTATRVAGQPVEAEPRTHACAADGGQNTALDAPCDVRMLTSAVSRAVGWPCQASSSPGQLADLPLSVVARLEVPLDGRGAGRSRQPSRCRRHRRARCTRAKRLRRGKWLGTCAKVSVPPPDRTARRRLTRRGFA